MNEIANGLARIVRILAEMGLLSALLGSRAAMAQDGGCPTDPWAFSMLIQDYIVNTTLDPQAVQKYLDDVVNPRLADDDNDSDQLGLFSQTAPATGILLVRQRAVRDEKGGLVGTQNVIIHLIVVKDPVSPGPFGLLVVGAVGDNPDVMDWFKSRCVSSGIVGSVETNTHITNPGDGLQRVKTEWEASDSQGSTDFEAKFTAPTPTGDPATVDSGPVGEAPVTALVGPAAFTVRFAWNPKPVLYEHANRVISEIPLGSADIDLHMSYNDTNPGLKLFDGTDASRITRLRYVPQGIQYMEIYPESNTDP